jgi:ubiquinol-cytochrome c reductase iron-sulfur subunit
MLDSLEKNGDRLRDPEAVEAQQPHYISGIYRSSRPEIAVIIGICTHLGCSPQFVPDMAPQEFDADWVGGFFCPCHGSRFDLAGRVYKGVPAPLNLVVPPYRYLDEDNIVIGVDEETA